MDVLGDVLPRSNLAEGFVLDGVRVPLLGPQGIFKPGVMTVDHDSDGYGCDALG